MLFCGCVSTLVPGPWGGPEFSLTTSECVYVTETEDRERVGH